MNDDVGARYVLTERGMRFLAERAGVPRGTFKRHGGITSFDPGQGERPEDALRYPEHTIGINRFVARLAVDLRALGGRLMEARNEAESTRRFASPGRAMAWVRPDASGVIDIDGARVTFLLEYDRGTLDGSDHRRKLEGYRRYYAARAWEADFPCEPLLLFVCSNDRAERRVVRAVTAVAMRRPILITTEWRYRAAGTLGDIWRDDQSARECLVTRVPARTHGKRSIGQDSTVESIARGHPMDDK